MVDMRDRSPGPRYIPEAKTMDAHYDPSTMSGADAEAIIARVDRYIRRHGSPYGETPVPGGDMEEARAVILADVLSADWAALEVTHYMRTGRTIFGPDLSTLGRHLRAALYMAGRAKRRGWVEAGPMRRAARAEARRRDMDDSTGAGMASRAADPARIVAAVEEAQRVGLFSTPDRFARRRSRIVKTRNTHGHYIEVVRRERDRTVIEFRPWTRFNFRRAGDMPNRGMPKTRNRVPAGTTADTLREAITG